MYVKKSSRRSCTVWREQIASAESEAEEAGPDNTGVGRAAGAGVGVDAG
jgi:hypothetical protein